MTLDVRDNDYSVKSLEDMLRNNTSLQCLQITVTTEYHNYITISSTSSLSSDIDLNIDNLYSQEEMSSHVGESIEFKPDLGTDDTPCSQGETAALGGETLGNDFLSPGVMACVDESETIYSVCSALVTALIKNTTLRELMIHTMDFFNDRLVHTLQQCQGYTEVKERIKIHEHDILNIL